MKIKPETTTLFIDLNLPPEAAEEITETTEWLYECRVAGLNAAEDAIEEMIELTYIEAKNL